MKKKIKLRKILLASLLILPVVVATSFSATAISIIDNNSSNIGELSNLSNDQLNEYTTIESTVLLKNDDNFLPLNKNDHKISIFGTASYNMICSTFEAKTPKENNLYNSLKKQGFKLNDDLNNIYIENISEDDVYWHNRYGFSWVDPKPYINELPISKILDNNVNIFKDSDTAIFTVLRGSGEGQDLTLDYLDLTIAEKEILNFLDSNFKNIIILLNTTNTMPLGWINDYKNIKSVLNVGTLGTKGIDGIGKLIDGTFSPSGRLVDTYTYDLSFFPSVNNYIGTWQNIDNPNLSSFAKYILYQENIYIGYKFFETLYTDVSSFDYSKYVQFPFGYGLSYTKFAYENFKLSTNDLDNDINTLDFTLDVHNIGNYSGSDSVLLYLQKPYTNYDRINQIEKPSIELIGFEKTKILNPGECETIQISVDVSNFKVYDEYNKKTYIDESGMYYFAIGNDVHSALVNIIDKQNGATNSNVIEYNHITNNDLPVDAETYSYSNNRKITNIFNDQDLHYYGYNFKYLSRSNWLDSLKYVGFANNTNIATRGIIDKLSTLIIDNNIDNLDFDNLYPNIYKNLNLLVQFGDNKYFNNEHKLNIGYIDGPTGMYNKFMYNSCTNMAQTFNRDLVFEIGKHIAQLCVDNHYNYWFGIPLNIHRNPLNGRNFEYFSEDSFLVTEMAVALAKGANQTKIKLCAKHLALNETENYRYGLATFANEQNIRETYLQPFAKLLESTNISMIMGGFNRFGLEWCNMSSSLMNIYLKGELNYTGLISTDFVGDFWSIYMNIYQAIMLNNIDVIICAADYNKLINNILYNYHISSNEDKQIFETNLKNSITKLSNQSNKDNFYNNQFKYIPFIFIVLSMSSILLISIIIIVLKVQKYIDARKKKIA